LKIFESLFLQEAIKKTIRGDSLIYQIISPLLKRIFCYSAIFFLLSSLGLLCSFLLFSTTSARHLIHLPFSQFSQNQRKKARKNGENSKNLLY